MNLKLVLTGLVVLVSDIAEAAETGPIQSRQILDLDLNYAFLGDSKKQNNVFYDPPAREQTDFNSNFDNNRDVGGDEDRKRLDPQESVPDLYERETFRRLPFYEQPHKTAWRPGSYGATIGESSSGKTSPEFQLTDDEWSSSNNNRYTSKVNRQQTNSDMKFKRRLSSNICEEYKRQWTSPSCSGLQQLIVGGKDAHIGEFPHMAALGFRGVNGIEWGRPSCGGSLISEDFVLTAAHCIITRTGPPVKVRLGVVNLHEQNWGRQDIEVEKTLTHHNYKESVKYFDIGLLKLKKCVRFSRNVHPACLAQPNNVVRRAVATGWGRRSSILQIPKRKNILQKVEMHIVDHKSCKRFYKKGFKELEKGIVRQMVCAGEPGKDACEGDSGGPLQFTVKGNKCVHHILGVVSFGPDMCGEIGVYSRVSSYLDWIESNVWPEDFKLYYEESLY